MPKIKKVSLLEAANAPVDWTPEVGITQSLAGATCSCPLRGRLMARRWRHIKKDKMTNFGTLVHEALDAFYSGKDWKKAMRDKIEVTTKKGTVRLEDMEFDQNLAIAVLNVYIELYAEDLELNWIEIENNFSVNVRGIQRRGKIDGVFADKKSKKAVWLKEHKTKSRINVNTLLAKLSFDFQNLYYAESYEAKSGKKVKGILYNVIRKPQLKLRAGESFPEFIDRVGDDVRKRPEWYFMRWEITFTPDQIKRWQVEIDAKLKWVSEMITGDIWWRNEHACDMPFECQYLDACSSGSMLGYYRGEHLFPELVDEKINEEETKNEPKKGTKNASKEKRSADAKKGCRKRSK